MDPVFAWIEGSALSIWLREAPTLWAFPLVLILHTWGLAFLVGANVALDVRLLGVARDVPLSASERCYPVMWVGFWVNAVSGVLLLIAYPTKGLTNPVFFVKLGLIAVGVLLTRVIRDELRAAMRAKALVLPSRLRLLAVMSLACWGASITAGRFLAYTYSRLLVDLVG